MATISSFEDLVRTAAGGRGPYPYQRRLAEGGLPEVLAVPTGTGKTLAAVLPWLYRRRFHPEPAVRSATPRRLVYVLPMRTLVEQSVSEIRGWLRALSLHEGEVRVECHVLMGGEKRLTEWRTDPERDAIIVGTIDMIISRALNRGYGESRFIWPIDFGLLNSDCHYVYDEVQLMGPALATSRQLHGLRGKLGVAAPCTSMWMSATVDESRLKTVDAPMFGNPAGLADDDWANPVLARRLNATKRVHAITTTGWGNYDRELASRIASEHAPGTLSIVIVNTVARAMTLHSLLLNSKIDAELVLVHSRFRPQDREQVVDRVRAEIDPAGPGRIVVSTQVIEAGLDVSSTTLITEAAPWPSIVQRAGRCNRDGQATGARLLWLMPPTKPSPYELADVAASASALAALEGVDVTPQMLGAVSVPVVEEVQSVLRRRDLLELFDTLADLSGNDVDIARFIRDSDDLDVAVAWRSGLAPGGPAASNATMPGKRERCPVSVGSFRDWLQKPPRAVNGVWRWDHLRAAWVAARAEDVRPGVVFLIDSHVGGYDPLRGWSPDAGAWVPPVADEPAADDQSTADDPATMDDRGWVTLRDHLADTERSAAAMLDLISPSHLSAHQLEAIVVAARLHDIGKAHPIFRSTIRATVGDDQRQPPDDLVLAKSAGNRRFHHSVPNFRHELASALALLGEGQVVLTDIEEKDLVVYLVAAHHGRVRVGARSLPGDERPGGKPALLGIGDNDSVPSVELPDGELPASTLDLGYFSLGRHEGQRSWSERSLELRDREDIGPFRLGYMEAIVRLADWRASSAPTFWTSTIEEEVRHD